MEMNKLLYTKQKNTIKLCSTYLSVTKMPCASFINRD